MSTSTLAQELKTRNVPLITDGSGGVAVVIMVNTRPCGVPVPYWSLSLGTANLALEVDAPELKDTGNVGGL